jgi:hypothetical protein
MTYLSSIGIHLDKSGSALRLVHDADLSSPANREGLQFMKELIELSREKCVCLCPPSAIAPDFLFSNATLILPRIASYSCSHKETLPMVLVAIEGAKSSKTQLLGGPAVFGPRLAPSEVRVAARLVLAAPMTGCSQITNGREIANHIAFVRRGGCTFIEKVRHLQAAGAVAVLIMDNQGPSAAARPLTMTGDGVDDVTIPAAYLNLRDGSALLSDLRQSDAIYVSLRGVFCSSRGPICGIHMFAPFMHLGTPIFPV